MTTQLANDALAYSAPAAADYSAATNRYRGASIAATTGKVTLIANGTTYLDGIIQEPVASGAQCRILGADGDILKVQAGASVTVGALASMDTTGRGVVSVTTGDLRFGKFLDAGSVGEVVRVRINRGLPAVP